MVGAAAAVAIPWRMSLKCDTVWMGSISRGLLVGSAHAVGTDAAASAWSVTTPMELAVLVQACASAAVVFALVQYCPGTY